jgi:hypothetical protein
MRSIFAAILLASAGSGAVLAQPLTCPAVSAATGPCQTFHYHVQLYRPDTRGFVEVIGANQFASQVACDRARDAQFARTMAVVEFFRARGDQQFQPDRVGPCHCDMTAERTSPNYLTDAQRSAQLKTAEEARRRVRERILDRDLPSDAELVRSLLPMPASNPLVNGPKLVPMPQRPATAEVTRSANELKATKAADTTLGSTAAQDLPLVEIPILGAAAPAPEPVPVMPVPAEAVPVPAPTEAPAPSPAPTPAPIAQTTEVAPEDPPLEDAAESFVSYENQRIQNVLVAASAMNDEAARSKVLEAAGQRIQLLANLRSLIEGSGARSRLANAARNAKTEEERLAFVAKLFGSDIPSHWAPKDAKDVAFDIEIEDPERVLRDSAGKFSDQQKRHALYAMLARTQPTEEQQLWLQTVVEGLLR